jgi:hypothetical protein
MPVDIRGSKIREARPLDCRFPFVMFRFPLPVFFFSHAQSP